MLVACCHLFVLTNQLITTSKLVKGKLTRKTRMTHRNHRINPPPHNILRHMPLFKAVGLYKGTNDEIIWRKYNLIKLFLAGHKIQVQAFA
jgi:hypothetical protein